KELASGSLRHTLREQSTASSRSAQTAIPPPTTKSAKLRTKNHGSDEKPCPGSTTNRKRCATPIRAKIDPVTRRYAFIRAPRRSYAYLAYFPAPDRCSDTYDSSPTTQLSWGTGGMQKRSPA